MKIKLLSVVLALAVALTVFSGVGFTVSAEELKEGDYFYTVASGKATITRTINSLSGDIVIPSTLGGYPVTKIDSLAFSNRSEITGIEIPDSVVTINSLAFSDCSNVKTLVIGKSVATISESAFDSCSNIESLTVSSENTKFFSKDNCLIEKSSKTLVKGCINSIIPSDGSVTKIGYGAFQYCTGLSEITIPNTVTSIGGYAFSSSGLTVVDLPVSVTEIGFQAFAYCPNLETVSISGPISMLSYGAFGDCNSLKILVLPASLKKIDFATFARCNSIELIYYFGTEKQLDDMYIDYDNGSIFDAGWICLGFPDVNYNEWYGEAVAFVVSSGLMTGYENGRFGTTDGIQRQDFVVILSRLSGYDSSVYEKQKAFKDVDPNAYYAAALAWAKDKEVSKGYDNGKFGVGDKVTREQIMTFLYNFAKMNGINVTVSDVEKQEIESKYSDFSKVSGFAKDATYWALSRGVITGRESGGKKFIAPQANAQRCEVAKIFYNIFGNGIFELEE